MADASMDDVLGELVQLGSDVEVLTLSFAPGVEPLHRYDVETCLRRARNARTEIDAARRLINDRAADRARTTP